MINEIESWLLSELEKSMPEAAPRVFPDFAPKGTQTPCAIYQLTEGDPEKFLDCGPSGYGLLGYQIRIYSNQRRESNRLRESVGKNLENRGLTPLNSGLIIESIEWAGLQNTYDPETKEYGSLSAVRIHWRTT